MNQLALRKRAALVVATLITMSGVAITTAVFAGDADATVPNTGNASGNVVLGDHGDDGVNQAASVS